MRTRIEGADALRGWATLFVLMTHVIIYVPRGNPLWGIANQGGHGVQLFYVLSAYLLCLNFYRDRAAGQYSLGSYALRRVFRIVPMFWLAIAINLALLGFAPRPYAPEGITWPTVVQTAFFLNGFRPDTITAVVLGGWSVTIEATFYVLLPLVLLFVRSLAAAIAFLAAAFLFSLWANPAVYEHFMSQPGADQALVWQYAWAFWFPAQLPVFGCGIVLFFATRNGVSRRAAQMAAVLGLGGVGYLLCRAASQETAMLAYGAAFASLTAGLLVIKLPILDNSVIRHIGKVSYSIYLLHLPILYAWIFWATAHGFNPRPGYAAFFGVLGALIVVCTAVASLTYRWIEVPGIRLGARITGLLGRRDPSGAGSAPAYPSTAVADQA